jgi:glycine/D-amino acid oxidase-like deaminating enzyme
MADFDVAVIGAGIHGVAAAYQLSVRDARVAIIDPRPPAGGPTGRSSAICRAYYTNAFLATCARDSIAMFERFEELTGSGAGFVRTGFLFLHPSDDADLVRASARRLNELEIAVDLLDVDDALDAAPGFDLSRVGIAAYERDAGYADPHAVTDGLFRRALALGAEARIGRTVSDIAPRGGGWTLALDDGSDVRCDRVLIAAGPWTKPLASKVGSDLPLTVERHVVATFSWGGVDPTPCHSDLINGYYLRREGEDLFLVGPTHEAPNADPDRFEESIRPAEVADLARHVVTRVPRLEASQSRGGWASLYDVSPDWQPVIGEIAEGVFVDAGSSGHGFKLAPALAGHVAALVLGLPTDDQLAGFHPSRFKSGGGLSAGYGDNLILG